jgi:hypothetical protein
MKTCTFPDSFVGDPKSITFVYIAKDACSWPLWNAVLECERLGIEKKGWVRDEHLKFARDRTEGKPVNKKDDPRTDWARDSKIVVGMDYHIRGLGRTKSGRPKVTEASQKVAEEFEKAGERIQATTVRAAYYTIRKRFVLRCIPRSENCFKLEPGKQIKIP